MLGPGPVRASMLCEHQATRSSLPPHGHQGEARGVKHTVGRLAFVLGLGDLISHFLICYPSGKMYFSLQLQSDLC